MERRGQVALVTGAGRGIGAALALDLASAGLDLVLVARSEGELLRVAERCWALGVQAVAIPVDLAQAKVREDLPGLIERVKEQLGRLDVLVHNAGLFVEEDLAAADLARWDAALDVNLRAVIHLTRHALPLLRASPAGAVISIASLASRKTYRGGGIYCASKHGLLAFSQALFEEVREDGIKVCAICPGYVDTAMQDGRALDRAAMIQPADIARSVRFVLDFPGNACPTEITILPQRSPRRR